MASSMLSLAIYALAHITVSYGSSVKVDLNLTWGPTTLAGIERYGILTNGQIPGPDLLWDEDDDIEVIVRNEMPFNTTVHWHGLRQQGTPWSDGVPGLSQKPIEPGQIYTYRFTAFPFGTYWYHSHSRSTSEDGLYGSIYIRPKPGANDPFHLISNDTKAIKAMKLAELKPQLAMLSDWDHLTSEEYFAAQVKTGLDIFCTDSILINGKGRVYCPDQKSLIDLNLPALTALFNGSVITDKGCFPEVFATQGRFHFNLSLVPPGLTSGCQATNHPLEVFNVKAADSWASFNMISGASLKSFTVSIDEHPMWIYAVDGQYIEPQLVDAVSMYMGERYSAMIQLDKTPGNYTIRVADAGDDQIISGFATLAYQDGQDIGVSLPSIDYNGQNITSNVVYLNSSIVPPFGVQPPSITADAMYKFNFGRLNYSWQWSLDGTEIYPPDRSAYQPLLLNLNSSAAQADGKIVIRTTSDSWVDFVLQVGANPEQPQQYPHPMHKHSNKAYIIGSALGLFTWSSVADAIEAVPHAFDLQNPAYRDMFVTSFEGPNWMVVRYHVENPGAFLFHCHIPTHLEGGMALALLDGTDRWPEVPAEYL